MNIDKAYFGLSIRDSEGNVVLAIDTVDYIGETKLPKGKTKRIVVKPDNIFTNGHYEVTLAVTERGELDDRQLLKQRNIASLSISGIRRNANSLVHPHTTVNEA